MKYKSTRGGVSGLSFADVLVSSYAADGGMYLPESIPRIPDDVLDSWVGWRYQDVCVEVLHLFVGEEIAKPALQAMVETAFAAFNPDRTSPSDPPIPLHRFGDLHLLDCSLGPTLAFKDVGQQVVGQLLNHVLAKQGRRAIIAVDTSGDTGPAAIAAVKTLPNVDIVCLYPHGRVTPVQVPFSPPLPCTRIPH